MTRLGRQGIGGRAYRHAGPVVLAGRNASDSQQGSPAPRSPSTYGHLMVDDEERSLRQVETAFGMPIELILGSAPDGSATARAR
jgi:hypothetical protein